VPKYQREPKGSIVDAVEPQIRELLPRFPEMPATVIAERIGGSRSYAVVRRRVRELRPVHQAADPVSQTGYEPGELDQCDLWFPPADIPLRFGQTDKLKAVPCFGWGRKGPGALSRTPSPRSPHCCVAPSMRDCK
jgi:hypothetical protein